MSLCTTKFCFDFALPSRTHVVGKLMRSCPNPIDITIRSEVDGVAVEKRVTNVGAEEHEGTRADKDYDSGLKSNDKGLE